MAQYLSTCMPWEIVVCVEYRDLMHEWNTTATPARDKAWHSISIPLLKAHRQPWCIALRKHKSREFRVTKLLTVVKGFSKDLVSVRTVQAIRWKKNCHPFKRHWLSVRNRNFIPPNDYPFEKIVIRSRSNGSGCPVEKIVIRSNGSSYLFKTIVIRATVPNRRGGAGGGGGGEPNSNTLY